VAGGARRPALLSGVLFLVLSVTRVRGWIADAIPRSRKPAISAEIGLFLGIIALKNAGIVVGDAETLVTLGNLKTPAAVLATTAAGVLVGVSPFGGVFALPPSLAPHLP
jgi:adenine/guanine/hypoxanthine permease